MSDSTPILKHWYTPYIPWLTRLAVVILTALAARYGIPPTVIEVIREVPVPIVEKPIPNLEEFGYAQTFGWQRDDRAIAKNSDEENTLQFRFTPAGKASLGDQDVYLWRSVRKANPGKPANWFPNVNQLNVGCCVGCAYKHGVDVLLASQIASGQQAEWKPVSVEAIYALSRVEIGGGRISGDGSVGAWAQDAVKKFGVLPMEKHGAVDLSDFSPARAREWGRAGLPDSLEPVAKNYPIKSTALVTSWRDVKRAIQQGYPVAVCSDQGFRMERDATGRCSPQGTWYHAMCLIGVRVGDKEGAFCLNSWGDKAHTGPVWPSDAPVAGFWVDAAVVERMVRQNDSFALSDAAGFPQRKLDWVVRAKVENPFKNLFTYKSEVSLSW